MKLNKKGLSLIELIVTIVIESILISSAIWYFHVDLQTEGTKTAILKDREQQNSAILIKKIIKEGHVRETGKIIGGAIVSDSTFKFKTSYFTNDVSNEEWYTLSCIKDKDDNFRLLGKRGDKSNEELLSNLSSCSFKYYDSKNNESSTNITAVKLNADYYLFNINNNDKKRQTHPRKDISIYSSMIHST